MMRNVWHIGICDETQVVAYYSTTFFASVTK